MRSRPYIAASEQPRPYGEVLAEREVYDIDAQLRRRTLDDIAQLEGQAADAADPAERKRLQCEAEGLRCALQEQSGSASCVRL